MRPDRPGKTRRAWRLHRIRTDGADGPPLALDTLPMPARRLLPLGRYRALGMPISMTTSRGCPHQCIFCVGRRMVGARVRFHSPARVVDELAYLATLGFHQVNLADDLFTAAATRAAGGDTELLDAMNALMAECKKIAEEQGVV